MKNLVAAWVSLSLSLVPGLSFAEEAAPEAPAPAKAATAPGASEPAAPSPDEAAPQTASEAAKATGSAAKAPVRVYEPEYRHRLDVGGAFGFNSGGGFGPFAGYGLTADLRLFQGLSLGATVGWGLWGAKLTPHARIYPLGISRGLFLEGGYTYNAGQDLDFCREGGDQGAFGSCSDSDRVTVDRRGVGTVNATLGYRHDLAGRGWIAAQAGWARRLDDPAYTVERGGTLTSDERDVLKFSRPGGLILGISGGFSVL